MTSRIGNCGGCTARFKVPDSFTGDRAKCRKCGGIIEIEPAASFEDPLPEQAPEQEPEQVTTEATVFNFASLRSHAAAAASPPERSDESTIESSGESSDEASPESTFVENETTEQAEPVEPIAQPPPQRAWSQPKTPPPRAEKRARPPEASGAEKHHEKRHLKVGAAIAVLLFVLGGAYLLFTSIGADAPEDSATPAISPKPGAPKRGAKAALPAPTSGSQDPADESETPAEAEPESAETASSESATSDLSFAESAPSESATDTEPDAAPEPVSAMFQFVALERSPGTTDEEWDRMQELSATLRDGGKARKLALKELLHYGIKAVPVLVNSLNGLDLSKYSQWVDGAEVSRFIQDDLLAETILIPYHGAFSTDVKEVRHNQVVLKSLVDYWNAQVNDPARWGALLRKYEEKRSMRGTRRN